jgi:hypothetical protein
MGTYIYWCDELEAFTFTTLKKKSIWQMGPQSYGRRWKPYQYILIGEL